MYNNNIIAEQNNRGNQPRTGEMKKMQDKSPSGLNLGGYVHRSVTGRANGFSYSCNAAKMSRNAAYAQQLLTLPRGRINNDLHLDVLALANAGNPHQPTVPRPRPQTQYPQSRRYGTAHSDTRAVEPEALRTSGRCEEHQRANTVDDKLLASKLREGLATPGGGGLFSKSPRNLDPLPKRPPSSSLTTRDIRLSFNKRPSFGTLPPIEGEPAQQETESDSVDRREEDSLSSPESSTDLEDEVCYEIECNSN